tara:strand:+ start:483 stop:1595 length:1113 start_codon:yes stop_codon:yes gene_type:complete
MALSKIDTTNMIEDVPQSKIDNNINFRNIIINGDMSIAQRGTSFAGANDDDYTLDRFMYDISGTDAYQFTISQSTDVPTGQGFAKSMKFDCTTADTSLDTDNYALIHTRLEGQNLQYLKKGTSNASSLTLSFWVKSNKTGTYIAELQDNDNNRVICKSYTISSSDTWEKKTITYAGDTSGAFDNDNGNSLKLNLWLLSGTQFSSGTLATSWESRTNANRAVGQVNLADSTSNEWYITGVQLEAGTSASDFEFLPVDVNLQRCQRYYYQFVDGINQPVGLCVGYSGVELYVHINFPTQMRTTPSLISSNNANDFRLRLSNLDNFDNWNTIHMATNRQILIVSSSQVSLSTGQAGWCESRNSTARVAFNSEL